MELSVCVTDDDYEAWRAIRIAVVPDERCDTVAELRAQDSSNRLLLLAVEDGAVVGSGMADKSETAGGGFAAPRVLPEYRRRGVGSALLGALAEHCTGLGLPTLRASVTQVLADFAVYTPLEISAAQWNRSWAGDPMFLALYQGEVIGCAGLHRDTDRPDRGENALTGVRRDWRGRGVASHLKLRTLQWAAANGLRELYTWTQAANSPMLGLNERLGYVTARNSITVSRPLPLVT